MPVNSLKDTPLETLYAIFNTNDDEALCTKMANIAIVYVIVSGLWFAFRPFPYGRYSHGGLTLNSNFGWMILDCGSLLFPLGLALFTPAVQLKNYTNIVSLSMFVLHYIQRSLIYPLTIPRQSTVSVSFVLVAFISTAFNGFLQGHHLINGSQVKESPLLFVGIFVYLLGLAINITHDQMLVSLGKRAATFANDSTVSTLKPRYVIPHGGLFHLISCANYFGEIIEWIGIAIATQQLPQIASAFWSSMFLGTRALHHHQFYIETFGSTYPKSRKAIIPFVL